MRLNLSDIIILNWSANKDLRATSYYQWLTFRFPPKLNDVNGWMWPHFVDLTTRVRLAKDNFQKPPLSTPSKKPSYEPFAKKSRSHYFATPCGWKALNLPAMNHHRRHRSVPFSMVGVPVSASRVAALSGPSVQKININGLGSFPCPVEDRLVVL